jgi:hypothetical protein
VVSQNENVMFNKWKFGVWLKNCIIWLNLWDCKELKWWIACLKKKTETMGGLRLLAKKVLG